MIIPYAKHDITEDDVRNVVKALHSSVISGGQYVSDFESAFNKYTSAFFSLAVSSGTAGLHLAVSALGVAPGKKVLVPSLTFAATANSVLYCSGDIEFVDIDPESLLIDIELIENKINTQPDKYAGIIVVDFAGYPFDIIALRKICDRYGLWIIEDAAHALGGSITTGLITENVGASNYADVTVFSFHPAKHITTGEGGMVTTKSDELYQRMKLLRSHAMDRSKPKPSGFDWSYEINSLGYNYRMSDINAALGVSQLKRAEKNLKKRQRLAHRYTSRLANLQLGLPTKTKQISHAFHLYVIQTEKRNELYEFLKDRGIVTQVHYTPLHLQSFYKNFDGAQSLYYTEHYFKRCLSLPLYPDLKLAEQDMIVDLIKTWLRG